MSKISDVTSLFNIIKSVQFDNKKCQMFFRGQKKKFPNVTPSIERDEYILSEDILFREYILRNPNDFSEEKTTFEKLVKMQHYKLPTRLLDITTNPLVALFFAVEEDSEFNNDDGDFIIYVIPNEKIKYYDSDTVSVVSNISRRPVKKLDIEHLKKRDDEKEEAWIERFNKEPDLQYLLHEIKDEKPYFKDIIKKEHLESIWCVKPLLKNRRIIKQDGAFLLFGMQNNKSKLASYTDFQPQRFVVQNKDKLRKQLELLGISKDKLYPELDTTAEYLKTKYKNNV